MSRVALLSNPVSTGNRAYLPRIRAFCAAHPDVFHYEVDAVDQIAAALASIARVKPRVLIINGGDGTVQAALTELHQGGHFGGNPPPVAVLPNGKTNLIALDLGSVGDPIIALERIMMLADSNLADHVVERELIALTQGVGRPTLGMFVGGAGLADAILYCRNKIYPLGLPNGVSHFLATLAVLVSLLSGIRTRFLPAIPQSVRVSLLKQNHIDGRFSLLIVTTLERMLLGSQTSRTHGNGLKLMAVDRSAFALVRAILAAVAGKLGVRTMNGVHLGQGDTIRIESERTNIIFDGELFSASRDYPITLRSTKAVPFLHLAA